MSIRGTRSSQSGAISNSSLYAEPYGDQDVGASAQQVPGTYQPGGKNDLASGQDVDENHGGVNQTVVMTDGAAGANTITYHSSSAPTPEDMGFM